MWLIWLGFILLVMALLAVDLFGFHRKAHVVAIGEALAWSAAWIAVGLAFGVFIYFGYQHHFLGMGLTPSRAHPHGLNGSHAAVAYYTGYLVEESLSVDNLFVISLVFLSFAIPDRFQRRVLFWGVIGAQVMRGGMVAIGAQLITHFSWMLYVFGAFLLVLAVKMMLGSHESAPADRWFVRLLRRWLPVTDTLHGQQFLAREQREISPSAPGAAGRMRWVLTPLAVALIVIEILDLLFAVDSIPAIFAITTDPFIVFTSNIFAILGLRAMYFALASVMRKFAYLKVSLAAILFLIGGKMLAHPWLHGIRHLGLIMLGAVVLILAIGMLASYLVPPSHPKADPAPVP